MYGLETSLGRIKITSLYFMCYGSIVQVRRSEMSFLGGGEEFKTSEDWEGMWEMGKKIHRGKRGSALPVGTAGSRLHKAGLEAQAADPAFVERFKPKSN